jgi:hypothetical protein
MYGASDDLFEIEGEFSEEVGCYDEDVHILCSDGTKAVCKYDGEWKFEVLEKGSLLEKQVPIEDGDPVDEDVKNIITSYSEALVFTEGLEWIEANEERFEK